jgi:hypothetical protein
MRDWLSGKELNKYSAFSGLSLTLLSKRLIMCQMKKILEKSEIG